MNDRNRVSFPGFSAEVALQRRYRVYQSIQVDATASNIVVPQAGYHMGCCPSGDCDSTWCAGSSAHLECNNGKANMVCDNCFLTTACTASRGLSDDCSELTLLRHFRDNYMSKTLEGQNLIKEYYQIAPSICDTINCRHDAKQIYDYLYRELVHPTIQMVTAEDFHSAREHYKRVTLSLREHICI